MFIIVALCFCHRCNAFRRRTSTWATCSGSAATLRRPSTCYNTVVEAVPGHWRSLLNLAVALMGLGRTGEAQRSLRAAFKACGARTAHWTV